MSLQTDFEGLFGKEPGIGNKYRSAWLYARKYFEGIFESSEPFVFVESALEDYELFRLGEPTFFRQRGRTLARFPGFPIDENPDEYTAVYASDQVVAARQVHLIKRGIQVFPVNPLVPFKYQKLNSELE
jgi:hypothetical protein